MRLTLIFGLFTCLGLACAQFRPAVSQRGRGGSSSRTYVSNSYGYGGQSHGGGYGGQSYGGGYGGHGGGYHGSSHSPCQKLYCGYTKCYNGYLNDYRGCPTCKCKHGGGGHGGGGHGRCPPLCRKHCPYGFEVDYSGCKICRCKQPPYHGSGYGQGGGHGRPVHGTSHGRGGPIRNLIRSIFRG